MTIRTAAIGTAAALMLLSPLSAVAAGEAGDPAPPPADGTASAPEVDEQTKVAPYVTPGIVYIETTWSAWLYDKNTQQYLNDGQSVTTSGSCTGYVVNPNGWIASAGHCFEYDQGMKAALLAEALRVLMQNPTFAAYPEETVAKYVAAYIRLEGEAQGDFKPDRSVAMAWGPSVSGTGVEEGKVARLVKFQPFDTGDAALLKVDETDLNALPLLPQGETVDPLTDVASIGYGAQQDALADIDFTPSIQTGTISATKTVGNRLVSVYEISADVFRGMSGGPTVTYGGEVVGTNSFGISREGAAAIGDEEGANFISQSARVWELLAGEGVTNELSPTTQDYRAGIDAYFAGNKARAVRLLSSVTRAQPEHEIAREYLARARNLPDPPPVSEEPDSTGLPGWVLWAAIAAAVLVLIAALAVAAYLAMRKRPQRAAAPPADATPQGVPASDGHAAAPAGVPMQRGPEPPPTPLCPTCSAPVGATPYCANCGTRLWTAKANGDPADVHHRSET